MGREDVAWALIKSAPVFSPKREKKSRKMFIDGWRKNVLISFIGLLAVSQKNGLIYTYKL